MEEPKAAQPTCYLGVMRWEGSESQYEVRIPDLPGVLALGFEPAEAVLNAAELALAWRAARNGAGQIVPEPTPHGAQLGEIGMGEVGVLVALPA